jgi:hypothetical protein
LVSEDVARPIPLEARDWIAQGKELKEFPKRLRLLLFSRAWRGPYVRFRWRKAGVNYMISLAGPEDYLPKPFEPEGV